MNNDYEMLDREMKAYHKGFEEGFENGIQGGMLQGIDYLMNLLVSIRQELLDKGEIKPNDENNT